VMLHGARPWQRKAVAAQGRGIRLTWHQADVASG